MDDLMRPAMPRPKPAKRIVDRDALPIDDAPLKQVVCPLCLRRTPDLSRHHVVPKGQGGDDVPENLVWICGDGTRGCHGVLTHHNRGDHGLTFEQVAAALLEYVRWIPPILEYASRAKWDGFLDSYYGGRREAAA